MKTIKNSKRNAFAALGMCVLALPLLMLGACSSDNEPAAGQEIVLTTPVVEFGGMKARVASRANDGFALNDNHLLQLWLHKTDARKESESRKGDYDYTYTNNSWQGVNPVSVTGGAGYYRASLMTVVNWEAVNPQPQDPMQADTGEERMPAILGATYAYRGTISVGADGTFTPSATLQPYSTAIQVLLKDANGDLLSFDNKYTLKLLGLAQMAGFAPGADGECFPHGEAEAVPAAAEAPVRMLKDGAWGDICPGNYPASWVNGTLEWVQVPTEGWPIFEIVYCADGFNELDPKGPYNTWTVSWAEGLSLQPGTLYTFCITLGGNAHITVSPADVDITPWQDGDNINVGK